MKFSRHVYFVILMCAYFATLKFRDFAKISEILILFNVFELNKTTLSKEQ